MDSKPKWVHLPPQASLRVGWDDNKVQTTFQRSEQQGESPGGNGHFLACAKRRLWGRYPVNMKTSKSRRSLRALRFATRKAWREWLERNHATKNVALLTFYKKAPKNASFSNRDAVEEALCFGWIDGWFKPIDSERWVIRYTPRRKGSSWSDYNIARAWKLLNEGKMTPAGVAKLPTEILRVWEKYRPRPIEVHPRNRTIRFADESIDYLGKVKKPALTP